MHSVATAAAPFSKHPQQQPPLQPQQPSLGKENHPMYSAPQGYFGVPPPSANTQQQQQATGAAFSGQFAPAPVAKTAATTTAGAASRADAQLHSNAAINSARRAAAGAPISKPAAEDWKRRPAAASGAPPGVAGPSARDLSAHLHGTHLSSNQLLKEVAAMKRAAAAASMSGGTAGLSLHGLSPAAAALQQQQAAAAAAHAGVRKAPSPPEGTRAVRSGSGTAALGNNSAAARTRRTGPPTHQPTSSFDQFSLWNDAEPTAQDWARRQQPSAVATAATGVASSVGRSHQLYPQTGVTATGPSGAQPFSSRPDANFQQPGHLHGNAAHNHAAAAARVEIRANYGAGLNKHANAPGGGVDLSAAAAASAASQAEAARANERVEKRFAYWKNFWSNIQQLRSKSGAAGGSIPDYAPGSAGADFGVNSPIQSSTATGPSGFGMNVSSAGGLRGDLSAGAAAAMLGMDEASFREAMREFGEPADSELEISHSIDPPMSAAQKQAARSPPAPQRAQAFVPSYDRTASVPAVSGQSSNTSAQNVAAQLAFQQYQQQFVSPTKAKLQQQQQSSPARPPSASKQQAAKHAVDKSRLEAANAAAAAASVATAAAAAPAAAAPSSAASAEATEAERTRQSNVDRFWAEEQARKGKPRTGAAAGGGSKQKHKHNKAAAHFQAPADPNDARNMWEKMKKELDSKWDKFTGAPAASSSQQQQQQPGDEKEGEKNAHKQAAAAAQQSTQQSTAETSSSGADSSRRSSAYAFTNLRKEDLKYAPAPAAAAAAPAPAPASKPPAHGAQFSSFSRPPQPHTTSSTAYTTGSTTDRPSHAASATAATIGAGITTHSTLVELFSRWGVRELRRELASYGVHAADLQKLVEKDEFVLRLVSTHIAAEHKKAARAKAAEAEVSKEALKEKITHEVDRWAQGRSIKSMLNELNGFTSAEQTGYLKRSDSLDQVSKSYKKALLRIHPDKHMDSIAKHLRATEVFKYVSQAFHEYKKKYEK